MRRSRPSRRRSAAAIPTRRLRPYQDLAAYRGPRRLRAVAELPERAAHPGRDHRTPERRRPARPGRRRFFRPGRKWRFVRAEARPRLMAVNADEGEPGTIKDRYYLETEPHKVLEGMLVAAWAVEGRRGLFLPARRIPPTSAKSCSPRSPRWKPPGWRPHTAIHLRRGRRRLYLRRRIGDDRIDRRQARPAAATVRPYVSQNGIFRPADPGQQCRDALLGSGHRREGRGLVRKPRPQRRQGPAQLLGLRPGPGSRASSWRRPASRSPN